MMILISVHAHWLRGYDVVVTKLPDRAQKIARELMVGLPRRWAHVQSVATKAQLLRPALGEADLLVAAAWLHDIGYSDRLVDVGFHPIDGARFLASRGESHELCCLVANHSAAAAEAELRGIGADMFEFPDDASPVRDALWACDMTTSPDGTAVPFTERLAEIRSRYGEHHTVSRSIIGAAEEIRQCIERTRLRAKACGFNVDLRV